MSKSNDITNNNNLGNDKTIDKSNYSPNKLNNEYEKSIAFMMMKKKRIIKNYTVQY